MKHTKNNVLVITVLILAFFGFLYAISSRGPEEKKAEQIFMKDMFAVTEADGYAGTQDAAEVFFDDIVGDYVIEQGGRYLLSGHLMGTLYIDTEDQNVHLIFDNVSVTGSNGPAVSVLSAGKVFLTSMEGTTNALGDSPVYDVKKSETACIYSTVDLTINGTGELLITGLYEDAVYCRDTLKILCSNLKVQSKRDCLRGNDGVLIQGNNISLEAERNGIRTTNSGNDARGDIEIRGAEISIIAGNYCINSASDFYVHQSDCFFKGIFGPYKVVGEVLAEEGSFSYV